MTSWLLASAVAASIGSVSVADQDKASARPVPPPPIGADSAGMFFISYPKESLKRQESGTVGYLVKIDREGRPMDCSIEESSGHKRLDNLTCATVVHHARFIADKSKDGSPALSTYRGKVVWTL